MRNFLAFLFFGAITGVLLWGLHFPQGDIPPLGKLVNPFSGFWQNSTGKKITLPQKVQIPDLKGKVTILYDDRLVPHIFADNEEDLFAAQGYVTAALRLWQMEIQTHAAAGRLSEIVGEKGLENDRRKRRLGMGYAAEQTLAAMLLNPTSKMMIENYTKGVNAYIKQLKMNELPLEYKLLNYKPEEWTPLKSAYLLKEMSLTLSGWDNDFEYTNFLKAFGREKLEVLFPDFPVGQEPVVNKRAFTNTEKDNSNKEKNSKNTTKTTVADKQKGWNFDAIAVPNPTVPYNPLFVKDSLLAKPNPRNGSNNWAVSGTKTASGYPILCNDPHLDIKLPAVWLEIQLHCPNFNVYGVSMPGAPAVIIGFNQSVAWGVTNARQDVMDWYKVQFKDSQRSAYWYNNDWKNTEKRIEVYKVRNQAIQIDTVVYTHHGVVSYDQNYSPVHAKEKTGYALRWAAHEGNNELLTFYQLNKAKNYEDFQQALVGYACPAQNFIFASVNNDIAIQVQGKLPVKWKEQGKFILDGSNPQHDWQQFIPENHKVQDKNPVSGFVSSANQHPADPSYPYYLFDASYEHYRNRRIHRLLDTMQRITAEKMMAMQLDNYNLLAAENLPFLLSQLNINDLGVAEKDIYNELSRWNYDNAPLEKAPIYFEMWIDTLQKSIYTDEYNTTKTQMPIPDQYVWLQLLKEQPDFDFFDDIRTPNNKENAKDLVHKSFMATAQVYAKWQKEIMAKSHLPTWANFKATHISHLFPPLKSFGYYYLQNGGNYNTINAVSNHHAPSWRMVVELRPEGTKGYGVYPGGQSGNAGSFYYGNMVKQWEKGEYNPLTFWQQPDDAKGKTLFKQTLSK